MEEIQAKSRKSKPKAEAVKIGPSDFGYWSIHFLQNRLSLIRV
jgi:hypothetical protein